MLVLTRKPGEQIIIAGNIRISVVNIGNGRVKLGIVAPEDVTIDREEIHTKKSDLTHEPATLPLVPTVTDEATPKAPALVNRIKNHVSRKPR
ncbi:MAG: carbon storage regulator [Fimbriiglobus sp.]